MSYAFISYKREDELRVGRIAQAIAAEGIEVWWDRGLPGGESWHSNLESKLTAAGCVIVVWSTASAGQEGGYVREEARRGLNRNVLVPVLIDNVGELPLGFGEIQAIDLSRWRGDRRDPFFVDLLATVRAKLANDTMPVPKGPSTRVRRRLFWGGGLSGAGLISMVLIISNSFGITSSLCSLRGAQPGLSDSCGAMGLGHRPSRDERLVWESRRPGSCEALREHIGRFPDGAYRSQAADLLAARKTSTSEEWVAVSKPLSLYQPAEGTAAKDEATAQAQALKQSQSSAERLCRGFGSGTLYRYQSAKPIPESWMCDKKADGVRCGFDGQAECSLQQRQEHEDESCG